MFGPKLPIKCIHGFFCIFLPRFLIYSCWVMMYADYKSNTIWKQLMASRSAPLSQILEQLFIYWSTFYTRGCLQRGIMSKAVPVTHGFANDFAWNTLSTHRLTWNLSLKVLRQAWRTSGKSEVRVWVFSLTQLRRKTHFGELWISVITQNITIWSSILL